MKAFNAMLGRLLNAGYVSQARELAALFEHDSPDLTIVLVRFCMLPVNITCARYKSALSLVSPPFKCFIVCLLAEDWIVEISASIMYLEQQCIGCVALLYHNSVASNWLKGSCRLSS